MSATENIRHSGLYAMGIAVSDLEVSRAFYEDIIGMRLDHKLELHNMDEYVMHSRVGGLVLVLMKFKDGKERELSRLPVKMVFHFPDPVAVAQEIREAGYQVVREPAPVPEVRNVVIGFARDPDGYLIELLQSQKQD